MRSYSSIHFFWAAALSATSRYEAFDTPSLWARDRHARRRFAAALLWLNVIPIGWFFVLYRWVIPAAPSLLAAVAAAVASLSVFGFHRVLHALIATDGRWQRYYATEQQICQVRNRGAFRQPQTFASHFVPGVLYIAACGSIAVLIGRFVS
jgi:hypothetical protein